MEAQRNGTQPSAAKNLEDAVGPAAPVAASRAGPTTVNLAGQTAANLAVPGLVAVVPVMRAPGMAPGTAPVFAPGLAPVVAPVMAPPGGQVNANMAGVLIPLGGAFDIAGALGRSDRPVKSDMRYKIWHKL